MRVLLKVLLCVFISHNRDNLQAQNLIPNSSFEYYKNCDYGDITKATPWFQPNQVGSSTDYYNECISPPNVTGIPSNFTGYQYARIGAAYAGFAAYVYSIINPGRSRAREYLECMLNDSLIAGKKYFVSFYVSLGDKSNFAIETLGAYFSNDSILYYAPSYNALTYIPQIINKTGFPMRDTMDWVLISDTLIAQGGERFMTIGNFNTDSTSNVDTLVKPISSSTFAYYYIDDVSVIPDTTTGILTPSPKGEGVFLYPNPVTDKLFIDLKLQAGIVQVILYDVMGKEQKSFLLKHSTQIDMQDFAKGVYIYKVYREKNLLQVGKVVKQ